ncbi:MAG TPA: 3-deoxy-manno-octulosonate cytidylyltransferase [Flavobacteriales bacterium]|nr:3-deoxy-manno-octulosonate cytidylyltransferase [Flavobacteriales bacterium]|tara:strand:- start:76628 stop:77380 length:753 start_codon:yes stop_codon:yes gene_type:complete
MSDEKQILAIIPARYASTRFPGKPLVKIGSKTMIQRVYEQVQQASGITKVIVATDDSRIAKEVQNFGGNVAFTAEHHQSGTDRCAEVLQKQPEQFDAVINVQGDEPFINPQSITDLCRLFENENVQIGTLIKKITSESELFDPNKPKVIIDKEGKALYFSRHTIPFLRNVAEKDWLAKHTFYQHIGIYGFTPETLLSITKLPVSSLEKAEALEQLRWLENGFSIHTKITPFESIGIDTPEDLEKIKPFIS